MTTIMKSSIKLFVLTLPLILLGSCQNYNELVKNPNLPTTVPPSLIITGILEHMNNENAWSGKQGSQSAAQFYVSTYDYYGTNNYDQAPFLKTTNNFEYAGALQNIEQMDIEAKNAGKPDLNPYSALGKFLRAYYYNLMSQKLGDLPLTDALQGAKDKAPKYDSQKTIYLQILTWLDQANSDLAQLIAAKDATLTGDIYLNNDLNKWQKVVNSFTLRVLVSLSLKANDPDLNIKSKFAAILADPGKYPVLTGLGDNLQYTFNAAYNPYPKNPTSLGRDGTRENVGQAYLAVVAGQNDPRTFIAATPAPRQVENKIMKIISGGTTTATVTTKPAHQFKGGETVVISGASVAGYNVTAVIQSVPTDSTLTYTVGGGLADVPRKPKDKGNDVSVGNVGKSISDFTAYLGAPAGLSMSTLGTNAQGGSYSYINPLRYSADFAGSKAEPAIIIGYPELCFNIAEGINLGWATGNAGTYYLNGITASMGFLGITEGGSIQVGNLNGSNIYGSVTTSIAVYLAQPAIQYKGGAAGLTQILTQKYIAFWQNSNWEAFFNQRRTGVPVFSQGPGSGNGNKIAIRWQYPRAEADANAANYAAAVQSQYGGVDDFNGKMWILQ
jgi:hypothetical protein